MEIIRKTILNDEQYLRQISKDVDLGARDYIEHIKNLERYCLDNECFALAAIQIGIPQRIIYLKNTKLDVPLEEKEYNEAKVLINPKILSKRGHTKFWEGCESCLDNFALINRPYEIVVEYFDEKGIIYNQIFKGFESTVLSHELDHLDGLLHMDIAEDLLQMPKDKRKTFRKKHPYQVISEDCDFDKEVLQNKYKKSQTKAAYVINKTDETIDTYNSIVKEYIEYFNTKDLDGNVQFQQEIDILVNMLKSGSKILDVGTAIGDYPKYLTEKCNKKFEVIGIDSSKNMIDVAINNAPKANFRLMDMRKLNFSENSFEAVICFATLIHVNDLEAIKILEKFNLLLKSNGIIIINVMEHLSGDKEIYDKEPFNPKYKTYFNLYTKDFFVNWFNEKGYKIVTIIDNPVFNKEEIKEPSKDINQFSIIVEKG